MVTPPKHQILYNIVVEFINNCKDFLLTNNSLQMLVYLNMITFIPPERILLQSVDFYL
jgi:hypothetical protein